MSERKFLVVIFCFTVFSCKIEADYHHNKAEFPPVRQYAPPVQYPQYIPYQKPGSRAYSNPYDIPPQGYYPYYDSDQYYVPPRSYKNYYYNDEGGNRNAPNMKY
ncbi:MAG: hypothetical protein A2887_06075 [Alphaproteobacteria bacterium RIFCSPLOWO2_01_FULL_40_26]|nr:MAG: hypothetical protein A3D15_04385 [Alphaproteobacteria bacterium RIFCSPHIGHO2_02_FULL_40_34]OFW94121.1 MAG: hypothetical protein A2887_06075 [Alphaproteobacteria bacterium RIFCSPLOWO2_01_FULL_40_26]OFX09706.1 MAG: hypothetical protein A3H30_06700 [Alphaproteobacteria bacterium RIFCSPLOWO2_02_FULL_40_19]OFX11386.1 MAG: hypothetical protein A3G22_06275 [Alphaproteobacteria bacterium RIFCSPLOWO2_12_FULL_40_11]